MQQKSATGPAPSGPRAWRRVGLGVLLLIGLSVRLVPWSVTFTEGGVRFRSDTDPYYHALRAQRILRTWPRTEWVDPNMNYPYGAEIPWPPLFDHAIATAAKATGATAEDPERIARVAAVLPLLIGVTLLPVVAWLGEILLGGGLWLDAALLVALLPSNMRYGAVGAADQHGLEVLIFSAILLTFASSWQEKSRRAAVRWKSPVILGVLVAAAFWNWLGSALYLLVLVGATGIWHVLAPSDDPAARSMARTLFQGAAVAAGVLFLSIGLWAPRGALGRGGLNGLTGLHVSMCVVTAVFGGLLPAARRFRLSSTALGRFVEVMAAGLVSLLPALASSALRGGMGLGLSALTRSDPWYRSINEYGPILLSGVRPLLTESREVLALLGLGLFCMPLAVPLLCKRWRDSRSDRPNLFFLLFWGSLFFGLTLYEMRFQLYLTVPMALWICFALRNVGERLARRWPLKAAQLRLGTPVVGALLIASPALPTAVTGRYAAQPPEVEAALIPALTWLRQTSSTDTNKPAVLGEWVIGHLVQYFANKPVALTPFGTAIDREATQADERSGMQDWAAFLFASDSKSADAILSRRHAGFVLLLNPTDGLRGALGFAPAGTEPPIEWSLNWLKGANISRIRPPFFDLIASRLYYFDGMSHGGSRPALAGYRLLYEGPLTQATGFGAPASSCKIFGVVRGASIAIRGANPVGELMVRARVVTNQNRRFEWKTRASVDSTGRAELQLPYATGANGLVQAGSYSISDGTHQGTLDLDEKDILGGTMEIDLSR